MPQEPERRPGDDRRQDARRCASGVERDDRERDAGDPAHAGRQPVDAVGEVDRVDDDHEPEHGQRDASVAEADVVDERQREVSTPARRPSPPIVAAAICPMSLTAGGRSKTSSSAPTTTISAAPPRSRVTVGVGQPDRLATRDPGEDRQPAHRRRRPVGQPAGARLVDGADPPSQPDRERRQDGATRQATANAPAQTSSHPVRGMAPSSHGHRPSISTARQTPRLADLGRSHRLGAPGRPAPDGRAPAPGGPRGRRHGPRLRPDRRARAAPGPRRDDARRPRRRQPRRQAARADLTHTTDAQVRQGEGLWPRHRAWFQRPGARRGGAEGPGGRHVRLRVGDAPAQHRLPAGTARVRARGDPARSADAVRGRCRKARPLPGSQGGVLPLRLRARSRCAVVARASTSRGSS